MHIPDQREDVSVCVPHKTSYYGLKFFLSRLAGSDPSCLVLRGWKTGDVWIQTLTSCLTSIPAGTHVVSLPAVGVKGHNRDHHVNSCSCWNDLLLILLIRGSIQNIFMTSLSSSLSRFFFHRVLVVLLVRTKYLSLDPSCPPSCSLSLCSTGFFFCPVVEIMWSNQSKPLIGPASVLLNGMHLLPSSPAGWLHLSYLSSFHLFESIAAFVPSFPRWLKHLFVSSSRAVFPPIKEFCARQPCWF